MKTLVTVLSFLLTLSIAINIYFYSSLPQENSRNSSIKSATSMDLDPPTNSKSPSFLIENSSASFETQEFSLQSQDLRKKHTNSTEQGRLALLQQAKNWLKQMKFAELTLFLRDYLKDHPQDAEFLILEADMLAQTTLLSDAITHYYSLLKLPMSKEQSEQVQGTIDSLTSNTITQLKKAYSWEILAEFVEPLLQIDPNKRLYILALARAYSEQQQINLMENILASLPFDDPDAQSIRDLVQNYDSELDPRESSAEADRTPPPQGRGIQLRQFGDHYIVSGRLSTNKVDLLIDTGASITALSRDYYRQLSARFKRDYMGRFKVNTANGGVMAPMYQFAELRIGNRQVENITVVVLPMGGLDKADGLLGMNFLREFDFRIDQRKALLHLK
jgi:clan AA aspartic protease (TIGR02281 family)